MVFAPQIFFIGAQKAGTTTLAYLLDQHPRVNVSNPKETHYFTRNLDKGWEWYRSCFVANSSEAVTVDASTTYTMANLLFRGTDRSQVYNDIPEMVNKVAPTAKFIYLVREPVERTYSGYLHNVRMGRESRRFRDILAEGMSPYLDISDYSGQLTRWLQYYPLSSFLIITFDELKRDPQALCNRCFQFMGLEDWPIEMNEIKNQSFLPGALGRKWNYLSFEYPFLSRIKRAIPHHLIKKIKSHIMNGKQMHELAAEERNYLQQYFYAKNEQFESLAGISLQVWNQKYGAAGGELPEAAGTDSILSS